MDKKLQLSKETLLSLEDTDLAAVAGGMGASPAQPHQPDQGGASTLLCSTVCDSVAVCQSAVCNSAACNTAVVCL